MEKLTLKEAVFSLLFGIFLSLLLVEIISNFVPLFQTDIRFIAEGMERDPVLYARFNPIDSTYFSADLIKYRVKMNPIVPDSNYYVRDETSTGDVFGVAIGDSFTYCAEINIDDCWVNLLEKKLGKNIVNMGGPGQFSITEEKILSEYGLSLKPKIVIWQFMTNDISEAAYFRDNNTEPAFYDVRKFLNGKSNLYLLLKRMVNAVSQSDRPVIKFQINGTENTFNNIDAALNTKAFCNTEISAETKNSILGSKQKSEESGSRFLLVMIPMEEEIYIEEYNDYLNSAYDLSCPIREIKEFAEHNDIDYIDMTSVLKQAKYEMPYLLNGGHLSKRGNVILSDVIYDFLKEKN